MGTLKVDKLTGRLGSTASAPITLSGDIATLGSGIVFPAGHVVQVVNVINSNSWTDNPSSAWIDIPTFNVSIVPNFTSSKILIMLHVQGQGRGGTNSAHFRVLRDSTTAVGVGDQEGSTRIRSSISAQSKDDYSLESGSTTILDTPTIPSTPVSIAYKVQVYSNNTVYVNRDYTFGDNATTVVNASTMTLMEIAG